MKMLHKWEMLKRAEVSGCPDSPIRPGLTTRPSQEQARCATQEHHRQPRGLRGGWSSAALSPSPVRVKNEKTEPEGLETAC